MANRYGCGFAAILAVWLLLPLETLWGEPPNSGSPPGVPTEPEPEGNRLQALGFRSEPMGGGMVPAGPSLASAGDMIGFSRELAGGSQSITLISASRKWMVVYHVDQAGLIRLVSSRPLDADFSFQFNATAPLPDEIRRLQGG